MASYISGSINFQGLGSGTDFTSIIAQLKKIESIPMQRMEIWKQDWQTRYEAFGKVLESIRAAKDTLSGMNSVEKFVSKIGTSSNPTTATITASGKAVDGTHSIDVTQLASNAVWSYDGNFTSKNDAIATADTTFSYTYKGKTRTIRIAGNTGLESFVNMINNDQQNLGIRASVVQSGSMYALQIQGKETGADAVLSITPASGLKFLSDPSWKSAGSYTGTETLWSGPGSGEFKTTVNGATHTFALTSGAAVNDLISAIDGQYGAGTASLDANGKLLIKGATEVKGPAASNVIDVPWWRSAASYGSADPVMKNWKSAAVASSGSVWTSDLTGSLDDPIHSGSSSAQFMFTLDSMPKMVTVPPNAKLADVAAAVNAAAGTSIASVEAADPNDPAQGGRLKVAGVTQARFMNLADASDNPLSLDGTLNTEPSPAVPFHAGGGNAKLTYSINGKTGQLNIGKGSSLNDIAARINSAGFDNAASVEPVDPGDLSQGYTLSIAGAEFIKFEGLKSGPDAYDWQSAPITAVSSLNDPLHAGGNNASLSYTLNGASHSISIVSGSSLQDIVDAVNLDAGANIASAEPVDAGDPAQGYTLKIAGATAASFSGLEDGGGNAVSVSGSSSNISELSLTGAQAEGSAARPQAFSFTVNGTAYSVNITPGKTTAQELVDLVNDEYRSATGATDDIAALEADPNNAGRNIISIAGASAAGADGVAGKSSVSTEGFVAGDFEYGGWAVTRPQNAKFMLDNWPSEMEASSNNVTGVLDGVTINLIDTGKAQLSVNTDMDSVRENIQKFLDTLNSVRTTIMELSKVDSETEYNFSVTKKTNPDDKVEENPQKGQPLTGNYGVQLLDSRMKSLTAGMPPGFEKIFGDDLLSGDLISSLSQLGIKTVSEEDDPNYGLLVVAPTSTVAAVQDMDTQKFEDALSKSLDAVLNFLAADDAGSSSSADFRYASHIKGGTRAGTYGVSYTVDYPGGAGTDPVIKVFIDGREANRDPSMDGYWFTSASGASAGLAVQIDNLNAGAHSGKVSIKQGKIREMEDFFAAELKDDYSNGASLGNNSGALVILQHNYTEVMKNIQKKIDREQERLANWERRQKLAYARLDTLLGQYSKNQERLESEIKKLPQQ